MVTVLFLPNTTDSESKKKPQYQGLFLWCAQFVPVSIVLFHHYLHVLAISYDQMFRIHTGHVAAGVYDHLAGHQGTVIVSAGSYAMRSGHDLAAITHTPSTTHAITLTVHASTPFYAT